MSEAWLRHRLDELRDAGALDAPHPGAGRTAERLERLASFGEEDLSVARLAEPHLDASAIAEDLGVSLSVDRLYGVWASGGPASTMTLHRDGASWCLTGDKPFCSGAGICDGALVTVACDGATPTDRSGDVLVDLDLVAARGSGRLRVERSGWSTTAFEDTCTATVVADGLVVPATAVLGTAQDYLDRAGFWLGALGPAAVWVGGLRGLVAAAAGARDGDAHDRAALGRMRALEWAATAWLRVAADEVDEHPGDLAGARRRAVTVRHLVQRTAIEVIDLFAQVGGPRSLAFDPMVVRRVQELQLYVRQFHGPVELELLGSPGPDVCTP